MTKALKTSMEKLSPNKKWTEITNQYVKQGKIFVKCLSVQRQHSSATVTPPTAGAFTLSQVSPNPMETTETRAK